MYQVVSCMLLVQVSWFLKHNNLVIRLYRVYDFDRKDDQGNLRELHLEKSIDVLTIGEPANSRSVTTKVDDLKSTLLVASDFFAVYKWESMFKLGKSMEILNWLLVIHNLSR